KTRIDFKGYATVTNGRGVLEGIGPLLKPEQMRRRSVTYRFKTRGGRIEEVQVVNGRGYLTTQHSVGGFIDDLFEAPTGRKRECQYVAERDAKGRVIKEMAHDRAGHVVYEFNYDPERNLGHYVNGEGASFARAGTGAAYVRFVWSDKDLQKE